MKTIDAFPSRQREVLLTMLGLPDTVVIIHGPIKSGKTELVDTICREDREIRVIDDGGPVEELRAKLQRHKLRLGATKPTRGLILVSQERIPSEPFGAHVIIETRRDEAPLVTYTSEE